MRVGLLSAPALAVCHRLWCKLGCWSPNTAAKENAVPSAMCVGCSLRRLKLAAASLRSCAHPQLFVLVACLSCIILQL